MDAIAKNFIIYVSSITASLSYCYFISSKIPKGVYRFISLIPVFYIFTVLPLLCTTFITTAVAFSFTTWLTNFKLIRFAFDLDHSPFRPSDSLLRFIIFTSLPIRSKATHSTAIDSSPKRYRFRIVYQILLFSVFARTAIIYRDRVHLKIVSVLYGWILFLLIDIVTGVVNAFLRLFTGLELEPSSNQPYLAISLQDFWGRWNLIVTNTLRHTVYKPVVTVFSGYKLAPLVGVLASFIVSGLMHEVLVYHLSRAAPTWEMTAFFVLHGICVVVEKILMRAMAGGGRRCQLPEFVRWLLTQVFVVVTGVSLFVPPFTKSLVDVKMLREYAWVADLIKSIISFYTSCIIKLYM